MQNIDFFKTQLEYLEQKILAKMKATSENIHSLNALNQSDEADLGSVMSMAKVDENIFSANNKELFEIRNALKKIKQNEYGICEMCGEEINAERLEVKPFARFCIKCRAIFEAQSANERKSGISNGKSRISNGKSRISNGKSAISNGKNAISNGKNAISNGKSAISNGKSAISNDGRKTQGRKTTTKGNKR